MRWPLDAGCMNEKIKYLHNPVYVVTANDYTEWGDLMVILTSDRNSLNIRCWKRDDRTEGFFRDLLAFQDLQAQRRGKNKRRSSRGLTQNLYEGLSEYCFCNSGAYRHNSTVLKVSPLVPGAEYLIILSTFHPLNERSQLSYTAEFISTHNPKLVVQQLVDGELIPVQ